MPNSLYNILDAMKDIVNPHVVLPLVLFKGNQWKLQVEEPDKLSKIKDLYIQGIPQGSFAFTLDGSGKCMKRLSYYINPKTKRGKQNERKPINKHCDLILFVPPEIDNETSCEILVLDVKSSRPSEKQLHNSELFVRYLLSMAEAFYDGISEDDVKNANFVWACTTTKPKPRSQKKMPVTGRSMSKSPNIVFVSPDPNRNAYVPVDQLLGR